MMADMIDKILLVDDDYSTNLYHEIILQESGIVQQLEIATTADEAYSSLDESSSPPDIVFLDINMPVKSGWDFLEDYSQLEPKKKAKNLIVLSTTKIPEEVVAAQNHKLIDRFYTKPLTIDMVKELLV